MSGPIASSRTRRRQWGRYAPALAVSLVTLLAIVTAITTVMVARHLNREAKDLSRVYFEVYHGLNTPGPDGAVAALVELGIQATGRGIPLVLTDETGAVIQTVNTPFPESPEDPRDPALLAYLAGLDADNPPHVTPGLGAVHFGPVPVHALLFRLGLLQATTILLMALVGWVAYRSATTAQRDRLWVAMAREAAHQMGTPLTSLQGWIEHLRGGRIPPGQIAEQLDADADRLQRVAHRFERIGNPARRDQIGLGALLERVAGYFQTRLPHRANAITLTVEAGGVGPMVEGDQVLLEWTLEALIKNAVDALQGRGGHIRLVADSDGGDARCYVIDDGPGIPRELRRHIFEPGMSTKRGGWGIGLALARRAIEDAHGGTISLEPVDQGTAFLIRLPLAPPRAPS